MKRGSSARLVHIPADSLTLEGILTIPLASKAMVIFAHGSGSSRSSPRNIFVAENLHKAGFSTLLFDLLTLKEDEIYENRFDIPLLTQRLKAATKWVVDQQEFCTFKIGYFGASTGAAAALDAAATLGTKISAVVSRGGRPDMAKYLSQVRSSTLLIVGGNDQEVLALNKGVLAVLSCEKDLQIVSGASHLFEEEGALEEVAGLAREWFKKYLT